MRGEQVHLGNWPTLYSRSTVGVMYESWTFGGPLRAVQNQGAPAHTRAQARACTRAHARTQTRARSVPWSMGGAPPLIEAADMRRPARRKAKYGCAASGRYLQQSWSGGRQSQSWIQAPRIWSGRGPAAAGTESDEGSRHLMDGAVNTEDGGSFAPASLLARLAEYFIRCKNHQNMLALLASTVVAPQRFASPGRSFGTFREGIMGTPCAFLAPCRWHFVTRGTIRLGGRQGDFV
jgi:hypothetical protein